MSYSTGLGALGKGGGGGHGGGGHHGGGGFHHGGGFRGRGFGGRRGWWGGWWGPWYGDGYYVQDVNPCTAPWLFANPQQACMLYLMSQQGY